MGESPVQRSGRVALDVTRELGAVWQLLRATCRAAIIRHRPGHRVRLRAVTVELLRAGNGSLPLLGLITLLVGMIMALQASVQLERFGAGERVADLVAISLARELAPLLTGIIVAGRYGSAVAAELATMRVSQEIDAYRVMGIDPIARLVVPRMLALAIATPCLEVFATAVGVLGGLTIGVSAVDMPALNYFQNSLAALTMEDIATGAFKALGFGLAIGLISCRRGLAAEGGAEQVGRATTGSVVQSIVCIIVLDLFVTALFYLAR